MQNSEGNPVDPLRKRRRLKVGEVLDVGGVKLLVEWAQAGRVLVSTPNIDGVDFSRDPDDGRTTRLTFAPVKSRMPAQADT